MKGLGDGGKDLSILKELEATLKEDSRLVDSEGRLLKNRVIELALKLDAGLMERLLLNDRLKLHFFTKIQLLNDDDAIWIFNKEKFMAFITNKRFLPDSHTVFKNKIGLINENGKFLSRSKEIVLAWPYKDCILEGGQVKSGEKRREVFHNVILAFDQIDRLLEPKAFTRFTRVDEYGDHKLQGFSRNNQALSPDRRSSGRVKSFSSRGLDVANQNGVSRERERDTGVIKKKGSMITDNLLIKGNNLLVLHSLVRVFREKVKLIYIDPPYNTGSDEFKYNDNFSHSTWLTFMKNRLEVARVLLRKDGVIFVQCDDNEQAYLKVLMDELFGRDNFVTTIVVKMSHLSGVKMSHVTKKPPKIKEYLLVYARDKDEVTFNPVHVRCSWWDAFARYTSYLVRDEDNPEDMTKWRAAPLREVAKRHGVDVNDKQAFEKFCLEHAHNIFRTARNRSETFQKLPKDDRFREIVTSTGLKKIVYKGEEVIFAADKLKNGQPMNILGDIWLHVSINNLHAEGGVTMRFGKKPENLLKTVLDMCTQEGDLVLDFFMGTGTTCAVAHKMARQYIGIEQMDYGDDDAVTRLKNVINGDPTGISKEVNWKGGGSFVYMELMMFNERFVKEIRDAETTEELLDIWNDMKRHAFLSYRVDPRLLDAHVNEFKTLDVLTQKRLLLELLEYNDLYVNYSEIDDAIYNVSELDKKLNRDFYGE